MRNQVWIIIVLIVWIGQWEYGIVERSPNLIVTGWAVQFRVEGLNSENSALILTGLGGDRSERMVWGPGEYLRRLGIIYMADVPHNTQVYLEKPVLGIPEPKSGRRGPKPTRLQVLNGIKSYPVSQVARRSDTTWQNIRVRP